MSNASPNLKFVVRVTVKTPGTAGSEANGALATTLTTGSSSIMVELACPAPLRV